MRALSAAELLAVWERAQGEPPYHRGLLLLSAACPEEPLDALAKLCIGRRDSRLLTLREWTFGPRLNGVTACPACGERLEIDLKVSDLRVEASEPQGDGFLLELDDYQVDVRLPSTADLSEVSRSEDKGRMHTALLRRCIKSVRRQDEEVDAELLPAHVIAAVNARMADQDPQAAMHLSLVCPDCSHHWKALFDIVSFFWSEIEAWAARMMREVHILASAYGWRETDIISMSPMRRQIYLNMVSV